MIDIIIKYFESINVSVNIIYRHRTNAKIKLNKNKIKIMKKDSQKFADQYSRGAGEISTGSEPHDRTQPNRYRVQN